MTKPVIGVSAWMEQARWGSFEAKVALLEKAYLTKIEQAGGIPLILPPSPATAGEAVAVLDALIIGGGADVDPAHYGAERHEATAISRDPGQDEGEMALANAAIEGGLPVLGICRGCQVLNVLYGGTLIQDLAELDGSVAHLASEGTGPDCNTYVPHRVRARRGSPLDAALGEGFEVQSWHHQGIATVGEGLDAVGRAEDGLVEAIADPAREFVLGVQWHPEVEPGIRLFEAIVEAAK